MGFLDKLLRRDSSAGDEGLKADAQIGQAECPHVTLVPKWDNAADIGKDDKATHFDCATCGTSFTPAEAAELRATTAERIGAD